MNPDTIQARARAQCKSGNDAGRYKLVSKRRALQLEDLDKEDKEKDAEYVEEKLPFKKGENKENMDAASLEVQKLFFLYDVEQEMKAMQKPISRVSSLWVFVLKSACKVSILRFPLISNLF